MGSLMEKCADNPQAKDIVLQPPPAPDELMMQPAIVDVLNNQPFNSDEEQQNFYNASFVDDNVICVVWNFTVTVLLQSLVVAFILLGWSWQDCHSSCTITEDKWANMDISMWSYLLGYYNINI
jgi:hypothetical protein